VIIDGTLIPIDRIAADRPFHSGKHKRHGVNLQVIASPDPQQRVDPCHHRHWVASNVSGDRPESSVLPDSGRETSNCGDPVQVPVRLGAVQRAEGVQALTEDVNRLDVAAQRGQCFGTGQPCHGEVFQKLRILIR